MDRTHLYFLSAVLVVSCSVAQSSSDASKQTPLFKSSNAATVVNSRPSTPQPNVQNAYQKPMTDQLTTARPASTTAAGVSAAKGDVAPLDEKKMSEASTAPKHDGKVAAKNNHATPSLFNAPAHGAVNSTASGELEGKFHLPAAAIVNEECGRSSQTRVTARSQPLPAAKGQWSWVVSIFTRGSSHPPCTAVIISSSWLLSAAHCVVESTGIDVTTKRKDLNYRVSDLYVRFSRYDLETNTVVDDEGKTVRVQSVFLPFEFAATSTKVKPGFDEHPQAKFVHPPYATHNVALLRLETELEWSVDVTPVCLPKKTDKFDGDICYLPQWRNSDMELEQLQYVGTRVQWRQSCSQAYGNLFSTDMICSESIEKTESRLCPAIRDAGAPLMCRNPEGAYVVAAILSLPAPCSEGYPATYSNVGFFRSWIEHTIQTYPLSGEISEDQKEPIMLRPKFDNSNLESGQSPVIVFKTGKPNKTAAASIVSAEVLPVALMLLTALTSRLR